MTVRRLATPREFGREVGFSLVAQGLATAIGAATWVVLARRLSQFEFGQLAVAIAVATLATTATAGYLPAAVPHRIARGDQRSVTGAALALAACGGVVGCTVAALLTLDHDVVDVGEARAPLFVLAGLLPIDLAMSALLRAGGRVGATILIDAAESTVTVAAITAVVSGGDVALAATCYAMGAAFSILASMVVAARAGLFTRPLIAAHEMLALVRFGIPIWIGNGLQYLTYRLDLLLVAALVATSAAAEYSVAMRLATTLLAGVGAVSAVVASRSAVGVPGELDRTTPRIFWATVVGGSAVAVVLAALAPPLVPAVFGDQYDSSGGVLRILLPGVVLVGGAAVLAEELTQRGRATWNLVNALFVLFAAVVLWVVFIPRWEVRGAATATSLAWALSSVATIYAYSRLSASAPGNLLRSLRWWRRL